MKMILATMLAASAGVAAADTRSASDDKADTTIDQAAIDLPRPGGLDSGFDNWGRYEVSASAPVSGLVRIGAHHARTWESNPAYPEVRFDISEYANDWDIEEMGLEIKAAYVPGYTIGVRFCARAGGNIGGKNGADDTLTISGASTYPETQLGTFDPTSGGCTTVMVYSPVEAGATEYTLMVRPLLQMVQQAYWQYTIYDKVTVQYYPILH